MWRSLRRRFRANAWSSRRLPRCFGFPAARGVCTRAPGRSERFRRSGTGRALGRDVHVVVGVRPQPEDYAARRYGTCGVLSSARSARLNDPRRNRIRSSPPRRRPQTNSRRHRNSISTRDPWGTPTVTRWRMRFATRLLGAAGLGDIGTHFPDTDPKWKDAASLRFLERVTRVALGASSPYRAHRRRRHYREAETRSSFSRHARSARKIAGHFHFRDQSESQNERRCGRDRTRRSDCRASDRHARRLTLDLV